MARTKKVRRKRCKWCKQYLDHRKHRNRTESYCYILHEKEIRSDAAPVITKLREAYVDGKLRSEFIGTDMEDKLLKRQHRLAINASLGLDCPRNLEWILEQEFVVSQVAYEKPWAVIWLSDGERKRKRFNSLWSAIEFWNKAKRLNTTASIVSLSRGYELPASMRFKKDKLKKKWKWCPHCVTFRVFKRVYPEQKFFANIKYETVDKKGNPTFEWAVRNVWLTECQLCGNTNRSAIFRRANQPYELRKVKPTKTKMKPRKGTPKRKKARSF